MSRLDTSAPSSGGRRRFGPGALVAAGLLGAGLGAQMGPALTGIPPVRRAVSPRLCGMGRPGHIALTFDDGPDPASTPYFLTELDRLGWKATFFMLGSLARASGGLAAEVAAAGHEIAVHGYVHRSHIWRTPGAVIDDVRRARDTLADLTGTAPRWLRPPYGTMSGAAPAAANRAGLELILWSAWGRDWRREATPESVVADIDTDLVSGGTVLLHDSDCTSSPGAWRAALGALPLLAEAWSGREWVAGPLADHGVGEVDVRRAQGRGSSALSGWAPPR